MAGAVVVGGVDTHAGAGHAVFTEGDAGGDSLLLEGAVLLVQVELVGLGVVGEENVGPAIVVVVEDGDAEAFGSGVKEAGFLGGIFELAAAQVVPEARGGSPVGLGRAVGLVGAVEGAVDVGLRRPLHVVGDDEVKLAVAVVIDPGGAG